MELTRQNAWKNKELITIVYGDNLTQKGMGGQAKEFRYLSNCFGVPTKKRPSMQDDAFFTDIEYIENIKAINLAINKIPYGKKIIVCPLGVGFAQLPQKAPLTFDYLLDQARMLTNRNNLSHLSIPEKECQSLSNKIAGAHVTSKAGVPHVIKRINHFVISFCYFKAFKIWRYFYPYGDMSTNGEQISNTFKNADSALDIIKTLKNNMI